MAQPQRNNDQDEQPGWDPKVVSGGGEGDGAPAGDLGLAPNDGGKDGGLRSISGEGKGDGVPSGNLYNASNSKDKDPKTDKSLGSREKDAVEGAGKYTGAAAGNPQATALKMAMQKAGSSKKKGGMAAGFATFFLVIFGFFLFTGSFSLVNIKEVYTDGVGGVQEAMAARRNRRLYSKAFFFREDGALDGFKRKGKITGLYSNYRTDKVLTELRARGYDIALEKVDGLKTGRIGSITKDGEKLWGINDGDSVGFKENFEQGKTKLSGILEEEFPTKGKVWRGNSTRLVWKRYNLRLQNWLTGKFEPAKVGQIANDAELSFRKALREKMFGPESGAPDPKTTFTAEEGGDEVAQEKANKLANELGEEFADVSDDALDSRAFAIDNPKAVIRSVDVEDVAKKAAKGGVKGGAKGAAISSINIAQNLDYVCAVKRIGDAVAVGSRVLRSAQLMKYAMAIFVIADSVKAGEGSGAEVSQMMNYLMKPNPNGKNFFSSGAWQQLTGNKNAIISPGNTARYSVSGGLSGTFQSIMATVNKSTISNGGCKVIGNVFFQLGGGAVSLALAGFTGGVSVGISAAVGAGLGVAFGILEEIAKPLLTNMAAGTIITSDEFSDESATALLTGTEVLNERKNTGMGMRALSIDESVTAYAEYDQYLAQQRAEQSTYEKYISFDNPESLRSRIGFATYAFTGNGLNGFLSGFSKIFNFSHLQSIGSTFNRMLFSRADAAANGLVVPCLFNDDIACSPLGVPITGFSSAEIDSGNTLEDLKWMVNNDQMDGDGNPMPGSDYEDYVAECFGTADSFYGDDNTPRSLCFEDGDNGEYARYRMATFDWYSSLDIADDFNQNFAVATGQDTSVVSTNGTISGTAQELAQKILDNEASGGGITFQNSYGQDQKNKTFIPIANGEEAVVNGSNTSIPSTTLSSELMRILLQANADGINFEILGVTTRDHSKDSAHYQGWAIDIYKNDELYKYLYENSTYAGGNFCISSLIHMGDVAGLSVGELNLFGGKPGNKDADGHLSHIHFSVDTDTVRGCEVL